KKFTLKNLTTKVQSIFTRKKGSRGHLDKNDATSPEIHIGHSLGAGGEDYWINLISSDPANPEYYKKLSEWYMYNNRREYAIKTLEYTSKLDPKDEKISKYLSNLKRGEV
ncbi:MAG: hypothetical protein U1C12_00920, partial [Patescibacteria group bacterium]|nr:hypothetical protein [Patescibacteria group bacterium]